MTLAISTTRPLPWVTGRLTNNGTITAAAITGRSSRMGPVFRAEPRSVASTVARTTPLTIIASVSWETLCAPGDGDHVGCPFGPGGDARESVPHQRRPARRWLA